MELGPCSIHGPLKKGSNGTDWNPYSWNNKANLFFLDQVFPLCCLYGIWFNQFVAVRKLVGNISPRTEIYIQSRSWIQLRRFVGWIL